MIEYVSTESSAAPPAPPIDTEGVTGHLASIIAIADRYMPAFVAQKTSSPAIQEFLEAYTELQTHLVDSEELCAALSLFVHLGFFHMQTFPS